MTLGRPSTVMLSVLALAATAGLAHAAASPGRLMLVANDFSGQSSVAGTRGTLEWDSRKGRWGLKLGVEQHTGRDYEWKDIQPGVYYRLTPRLHIGGAVSLAPVEVGNQRLAEPQLPAPRVRLETTFKF